MSEKLNEVKPVFRMWLVYRGKNVLGKGGADLLKAIEETGSLSAAAKSLGMSYRYAWSYIAKIEERMGEPVVFSTRGGRGGGGGMRLTELGRGLLRLYRRFENLLEKAMEQEARR